MFGYCLIKKSRLSELEVKEERLAKERERNRSYLYDHIFWSDKVDEAYRKIDELDNQVHEYKTAYLDELTKRLELAKALKELEAKVED